MNGMTSKIPLGVVDDDRQSNQKILNNPTSPDVSLPTNHAARHALSVQIMEEYRATRRLTADLNGLLGTRLTLYLVGIILLAAVGYAKYADWTSLTFLFISAMLPVAILVVSGDICHKVLNTIVICHKLKTTKFFVCDPLKTISDDPIQDMAGI